MSDISTVFVRLRGDDEMKAKEFIFQSIGICADHTLSRKLLEHFGPTSREGIVRAIYDERKLIWRDPALDCTHPTTVERSNGLRPRERLSMFASEYLSSAPQAIVVCEDWFAKRRTYANWDEVVPTPPYKCFGDDEVYHILSQPTEDLDAIEDVISPSAHWQTGVCSVCESVPDGDIPDESFLKKIAIHSRHIFVTAFDNTGFLIWSPMGENEGR